jgi:hypothetical protein
VQLRIAYLAGIETTKRQTKFCERCAAAPADKGVGHFVIAQYCLFPPHIRILHVIKVAA